MAMVTKELSQEHQDILKVISAVFGACEKIDASGELDKKFFTEAIDFVKNYADKFHHAKEENILFEYLNRDGVLTHCNPVPQMIFEHEQGRAFVKSWEAGVGKGDKKLVKENARGYGMLLQQHIDKEDNILYPMAEEGLSDAQKAEIEVKFKKVQADFAASNKKYLAFAKECAKRLAPKAGSPTP